jgi:hypothetical protein
MVELTQGEFAQVARGATIVPGAGPDADWLILGMGSSARAAIRRVHDTSPAFAQSDFSGKVARFLLQGGAARAAAQGLTACVARYIALDGTGGPALALPTKGFGVTYPPGNVVRARPDVILGPDANGDFEARVLLWDDLPLNAHSAELIALPVFDYLQATIDPTATGLVNVWQLRRRQEETVTPQSAATRRSEVATLLASL